MTRMFLNTPLTPPATQTSGAPPSQRDNIRAAIVLVVLAYCLIYLLPLGIRPIMFPDETRYGEIPREMLVSGDWAVPHLIDLRYFEKPPLGYWLTAISIGVFGENVFAVRLSSALATGLSAWFIWLLLVRTGHGQGAALAAAAVFLSFTEVLVIGTTALLDNPFSLFLTGGMVLFYLAANGSAAVRQQRLYFMAAGVLFGLAFLTKGFLAIVLPGLVLLPYCLIQRRYKLLWQCGWLALSAALTILPWAIIIHLREADFWHYFIWEEHIRRFLSDNAQHAEPMHFYLALLPFVMFPWSGFIPAAIAGLRLSKNQADLLRYLLLWFFMPFIFFSISRGKLPTYILPCMIPAAILLAMGMLNYLRAGRKRLIVLGVVINTGMLLAGLAGLLYRQYQADAVPLYSADESTRLYALLAGLVAVILLTVSAGFISRARQRIAAIAASMAILFVVLNASLPVAVLNTKSPSLLFEQVAAKLDPNTVLVSDGNAVRAVAWTLKRSDIYLLFAGELVYGLTYPEHADRRLGVNGLRKLLAQQLGGELKRDIAVFCEEPCPASVSSLLGPPAEHYTNTRFSVWRLPYVR